MLLPIQFTYLFGASLFFIPWAIIFMVRKDVRPVMIQMGVLALFLGPLAEFLWWTKDWWRPMTITGTVVGVEDLILSFSSVGVASSLYLVVFRQRLHETGGGSRNRKIFAVIATLNVGLFAILFAAGLNSFIATLIVFVIATAMLLASKRDLIVPAILSGVLMVLVSIPVYLAMTTVTPTFVEETWLMHNMMGVYWLGVPVEDFIFYFFGGALCFSAYPFYSNAALRRFA